jgi:hypothetical protein
MQGSLHRNYIMLWPKYFEDFLGWINAPELLSISFFVKAQKHVVVETLVITFEYQSMCLQKAIKSNS